MSSKLSPDIGSTIGAIPYRLALAGGWIDQPFVSRHNPQSCGSMVVLAVEANSWFMDREGLDTGTRRVAWDFWDGALPDNSDPAELVEELYAEENRGKSEPSGSQDMIGLIYPGVSRLDYDFTHKGGVFPRHIESNNDPQVAKWLQSVIHILPIAQRPDGYNPLGMKNLDPQLIGRLGQTGADCYDAILARDVSSLGASMNQCMECWEAILPHTVRHPTVTTDLLGIMRFYQENYPGAMYSGCGGGYLYVVSEERVPGAFHPTVRIASEGR